MPELPEVETVRRSVAAQCVGQRITAVEELNEAILAGISAAAFRAAVCGRTIASLGRRGKYLLIELDSGDAVVVHLRMTGQLLIGGGEALPADKHRHLLWRLDRGCLYYRDVRRFGRFWLAVGGDITTVSGLSALGAEPFDPEFTVDYLARGLQKHSCPLKAMLLDQHFIAGIGNIYADEILFRARLHPQRPANSLTAAELEALRLCSIEVLQQAIDGHGTTFRDFRDGYNARGEFGEKLMVFGRGGETCFDCGATLVKCRCAGRGTTYCPTCQREEGEGSL